MFYFFISSHLNTTLFEVTTVYMPYKNKRKLTPKVVANLPLLSSVSQWWIQVPGITMPPQSYGRLKLSIDIFQHAILNANFFFWIDAVLEVKDIIVIFRKKETILILISLKRYFLHPEQAILNLSLP